MGRRCGRCGETKDFSEFTYHRGVRKWDSYCRPCSSDYKKEHYAKNKQRYIDKARARNRRIMQERVRFLIDYFREHPCVDCGADDPLVLEFDHLGDKSFNVSYGIRERSWELVLKEMAKCEVVCANCHRRRTARRGGFARAVAADQERAGDR